RNLSMGMPSLGALLRYVFQAGRRSPKGRAGKSARRRWAARPLTVEPLESRLVPASTLRAISVPPSAQPPSDTAAGASLFPALSDDGRYVAFRSDAPNLLAGQTGQARKNVFLLHRSTGTTSLVS